MPQSELYEVALVYHHVEIVSDNPSECTQVITVQTMGTSFGDAADKAVKADLLPPKLKERELYDIDTVSVELIDDGRGRDVRLPELLV